MEHEFVSPHVVEIPLIRQPLTPDDFGIFPRPISGGSPELDDDDYSIGIAEFAIRLAKEAYGNPDADK